MSEIEAIPEIQALNERDEPHEVSSTEEVINVIDIEIDPLKEKGIEMDYAEDPKQVRQNKIQDIGVMPLTEPSQNPSKPENPVKDTSSSEFKPYSFYVDD